MAQSLTATPAPASHLPPATVWGAAVQRLPLHPHLREQVEVEPARRYERCRRTAMLESPWWPPAPTT